MLLAYKRARVQFTMRVLVGLILAAVAVVGQPASLAQPAAVEAWTVGIQVELRILPRRRRYRQSRAGPDPLGHFGA